MTRDRGDPAVDRLADLADHHEVIDRRPAQWPKTCLPGLRERGIRGAKIAWNFAPIVRVASRVIRLDCIAHVFAPGIASKRKRSTNRSMIFDD
jgi:hypothetical protein